MALTLTRFNVTIINSDGFPQELKRNAFSIPEMLTTLHEEEGIKKIKNIQIMDDGVTTADVAFSENVPAVPTGLTVTATGATSIEIDHAPVPGATWYEYSLDDAPGVHYQAADLPLTIGELTAETLYSVQVRNGNGNGASDWSDAVTDTTDAA